MAAIPRVVHFVFGLEEQREPFHFLHYAAIESCRRVLAPDAICFHHKHLPWGPWWERISPHLLLREVDQVNEVLVSDYRRGHVPSRFRYAHHADFVRLDVLLEHGGIYADIDTIFLRDFPAALFDAPFVIGREPAVIHERTGERLPSLCNALLMSEPGADFARAWRDGMADALDGTWSNHSGFLSERLSRRMPAAARVVPQNTFFPFAAQREHLSKLLEASAPVPADALSVHLWAHLWWQRERRDFTAAHAGWYTPSTIPRLRTTLAAIVRPYLPERGVGPRKAQASARPATAASGSGRRWRYISLDDDTGYGIAADRCMAALGESGVGLDWTPLVRGGAWGLGHAPVRSLEGGTASRVVVSHTVAEYLPRVRQEHPEAFLVGHTVWDTDRLPDHWIPCLEVADLLVVPSRFSAQAISAASLSTPLAVVPHVAPPIDPRPRAAWSELADDVVVFYTIAEWNERKAVSKTVDAYLRAFTGRDPVVLLVKTSQYDRRVRPARSGGAVRPGTSAWALARLLAAHPDPPAIQLITRMLSAGEISGLHRRGDCFVSLCRSEGWGLGAFDAAAHGNPVVTTGFGGHLDYLAGSPYLVDFDLVAVHDPANVGSYGPDQHWAEPDVDHGAALLRAVGADPALARRQSRPLGEQIRSRYRPAAVGAAFRSAVEQAYTARERQDATAHRP